jgi:hypothetical protein
MARDIWRNNVAAYGGDREMNLSWAESTDDVDPQDAIRCGVYVNGTLADLGFGKGSSISYGSSGKTSSRCSPSTRPGTGRRRRRSSRRSDADGRPLRSALASVHFRAGTTGYFFV